METIPLIFPMHLSVEQKAELLAISSELSTILCYYSAIVLETQTLGENALLSIINDITASVHYNQFKRFKFTSYNLRISMIKLSFILDRSSELTSTSSAIIDKVLTSSIKQIEIIIVDCYDLYLDSQD